MFFTTSGYTFAVILVILSYGAIRREAWAIATSYGLSTIFSIALGEAVMAYQNAGHDGNTIVWAVWFLLPFAVLTYLHLLVMRLRAETSAQFKVGMGVGGFAVTALAFEITRAISQQNNPVGNSGVRLHDFVMNRDLNTTTLLGLGALVLLLRLSSKVRADEARNQVLNLSGLMALALALFDSFTTVADPTNVAVHSIALGVVIVVLLVNSRTGFAVPQVVAAFAAGVPLLLFATQTAAGWIVSYSGWLGVPGDYGVAAAIYSSGPYVAFLASLLWFGAVQKLTHKVVLSDLTKKVTLLAVTVLSAISISRIGWLTSIVAGSGNSTSVTSYHAPNTQIALSASTLAVLFIWRWIYRKSTTHFAVLTSGLIMSIAGSLSVFASPADVANSNLTFGVVLMLAVLLLLADSLVMRVAESTLVGILPFLVAAWLFAHEMVLALQVHLVAWNLILPLAAFALAMLVLRAIKSVDSWWFVALTPIAVVSSITEFVAANTLVAVDNSSDWRAMHNTIDWPVNLVVALLALSVTVWLGNKIDQTAKISLAASSAILWLTGLSLVLFTTDHTWVDTGVYTDTEVARNVEALVYLVVSTAVIYWHALAAKSRVSLVLGAAGSVASGFIADAVVHDWYLSWAAGPEVGALVAAAGLTIGAFAYVKVIGKPKSTLFSWGIPAAALLWPSVLFTFSSGEISQPWSQLDGYGIARLIALALVGTIVMLTGMRQGNRGLVYASVATLMLEFVPALWFAIGNLFAGDAQNVATELRGVLIAATIYVVQAILRRVVSLRINSAIVWGVPAVVSLAPTLVDVWAALGHGVGDADWVRFAVLVSVSTGFLVLGAIRRLSGLFYPGFIGVIAAVLPYAFGAGGGLWIVGTLVVLAALIIWVAVRIDRFTGWLKELS